MKFLNKRRFIVCMAAVGIMGAVSTVALAEDTSSPPTSGVVGNDNSAINVWGQCRSGQNVLLPVFGRILPSASGNSKISYKDDYVTAEVYNGSDTDKTVTLATYKEHYAHPNYDDMLLPSGEIEFFGQRVNDYEEVVVKPGELIRLTAQMPWCSTQIDLFCGKAVNYLGNKNRFLQRNMVWYHAHDTTTNAPKTTWCSGECVVKMDILRLDGITEGQKVEPGTKLNIGAVTSGRTPYAVGFKLTGPNDLVLTNNDLRSPYSYNVDTSTLPEGDYTITAAVFDTYRFEQNQPCDTKTLNFRIVRAHSFIAGFKPNDYCTLSPNMDGNKDTGLTTPQWIDISAWVETYNSAGQKEGGLPVKVSSSWSIVHPSINASDEREKAAAEEMGCPTGTRSVSSCDTTGQETQVITTDATTGRLDFTIRVWWPGIMATYANLLPHYLDLSSVRVDNQTLNALYQNYVNMHNLGVLSVENLYSMTVAGGSAGNFPLVNLDTSTVMTNSISWSPKTYSYNNGVDQTGKPWEYQHANGCTLTLVPDAAQ